MTWTKKLAAYLMRRGNQFQATAVLLDLREWNSEIAKPRPKGEYDRQTVKDALAQLDEKTYGWFCLVKSYTWAIHKILVRPVQFALDQKSQSLGKAPKLPTGNPMFDAEHKRRAIQQQQQDISTMRSLTAKLGLKFTDDALMRMWRYAGQKISQVTEAIKYMLYCDSDKKYQGQDGIAKPHGNLVMRSIFALTIIRLNLFTKRSTSSMSMAVWVDITTLFTLIFEERLRDGTLKLSYSLLLELFGNSDRYSLDWDIVEYFSHQSV